MNNINEMVKNAKEALKVMHDFTQEKVDKITKAMVDAGYNNSELLAKEAFEETGRGVETDKATKNKFATENVWNSIKNNKTVGIINDDKEQGLTEIAEPMGVIAGIVPVTNPTSTTMFKAILAMKTRNSIIFSFHPQANQSSIKAAQIMQDAAVKAGAPKDSIQWIEKPSIDATNDLINNDGVDITLATGGPGLVSSAYSSGKPALGVGPGNGPVYIEKTADLDQAVKDLVFSKTFDNGMICSTENSAVIDDSIYQEIVEKLKNNHVYFVPEDEKEKVTKAMFDDQRLSVKGPIAGASAQKIADLAEIEIPTGTKVLAIEMNGIGAKYPMSGEKLCPVISVYRASSKEDAFDKVNQLLNYGGLGHTAAIQTKDDDVVTEYGMKEPATRIIVNAPSGLGGVGDLYNNLKPSLTLGTGTWGKNSFSHNLSDSDLLNIKIIARRK
ncbi:aldehyde dehydrogenase family protein [Lactobacillus sp. S2-2]|nr:aldehyde dehydrogenase family protein [Lactobacillus sp. S2-2]